MHFLKLVAFILVIATHAVAQNSSMGTTDGTDLILSTGGSVHMRIAPSGNVGVGTSSPTITLDVAGAIKIANDATACTAAVAGSIRYNTGSVEYCNGSTWGGLGGGGSGTASSMVTGWPDAIKCVKDSDNDTQILTLFIDYAAGTKLYRTVSNSSGNQVYFNSDGSINSYTVYSNCNKSISQLYTDGQAFNFVGGNGSDISLTTLADVSATAPTDGQVLAWSNANNRWEAAAAASGLPSGTNGQTLQHDGSNWVATSNNQSASTMVTEFPDAIMCQHTNGDDLILYLAYPDSSSKALYYALTSTARHAYFNLDGSLDSLTSTLCPGVTSIADLYNQGRAFNFVGGNGSDISLTTLADVSATAPTDGQVIAWSNANSRWEASTAASGLPSGTNGQTLQHDGSNWVASSNNQSASTILAGWPDVITCRSADYFIPLFLTASQTSTDEITYRFITGGSDNNNYNIYFDKNTQAYKGHNNLATYDCVSSTKSIATLYSEGNAFNFVGGNGSDISLTTLADVSATAPTDGQVLAWSNANSRWEAAAAASGLPSGTNGQTLQHDGSNWVASSNNQSASSMIAGFPDAIVCDFSDPNWNSVTLYQIAGIGESTIRYRFAAYSGQYDVNFNNDGSFMSYVGFVTGDCSKSISQLYTDGQAFNFVGGNGGDISLTTLADVSATAPSDGQVLAWNNANSAWEPTAQTASEIGTLTNTKWCTSDGSVINCTSDAPAGGGGGSSTGDVKGIYMNGSQSIPSGSSTNINTTITKNDFSAGDISSGVFTVPSGEAGWYTLSYNAFYSAGATTGTSGRIVVNSQNVAVDQSTTPSGAAYGTMSSASANVYLNAGDTVNFAMSQNSGSSQSITHAGSIVRMNAFGDLANVSDVSDTTPTDGQVLTWDDSVKSWKPADATGGSGGSSSASSMISGWPDAISCDTTNPNWGKRIIFLSVAPGTDGKYYYRETDSSATSYGAIYNSDGSFSSYENYTTANCNKSISQLYTDGQAFNFIDSAGASTVGGLKDVSSTTPTDGQVLTWDDSVKSWKPAGEITMGNSGAACSASNEGAMRYNSTSKAMEFCNGTAWGAVSGGGGSSDNLPLGTIVAYGGNATPTGWAFADGSLIAITANPDLFAILGTTFGGDGRSTFGLPDLRGRFPRGAGTGPGLAAVPLGQKQNDTIKSHQHESGPYFSAGGTPWAPHGTTSTRWDGSYAGQSIGTTALSGATGDTETRPVNLAVNFIIKISN